MKHPHFGTVALIFIAFGIAIAIVPILTGCVDVPTAENMAYTANLEWIDQVELRGCMLKYGIPEDEVREVSFDHPSYWLGTKHQIQKAVEFVEPVRLLPVIPGIRECTDRGGGAMYSIRGLKYPGIAVATVKYRRPGKIEGHKGLLFFYKPAWDKSPHILLVELLVSPGHPDAIVEFGMSKISHIEGIEM